MVLSVSQLLFSTAGSLTPTAISTTVPSTPATHWTMSEEIPLYVPPDPKATRCFAFLDKVNARYNTSLESYHDLYTWSTEHIDLFWSLVWDDVTIIGDKGNHVVDNQAMPAANPSWFQEARLNWAENMLLCRSGHKIALIQASMFSRIVLADSPDQQRQPSLLRIVRRLQTDASHMHNCIPL